MHYLDFVFQDCRYALRSIKRHPGLAMTTVLTLALGIGLNASVFTVLQGLLFRARVEKDPASFVHLSPEYKSEITRHETPWSVSIHDYREYAASAQTLSDLAAWGTVHASLNEAGADLALLVTCNFFRVYGLGAPRAGRVFAANECSTPGSAPVVVIGEEMWRNRFHSDPDIVGSSIRLNRIPFTIIGVIPAAFAGRLRGPGIWIPWTMQSVFFQDVDLFKTPAVRWLTVEGRMKPGQTRTAIQSELAVIAARLDRNVPGRETIMRITNGSFAEEPAMRANLFWMEPVIMGGLTLILLISCTNVTILQLSRAGGRAREMGIRLAIGAGRMRLVRMMLTEILILAAISGCIAAFIARETPLIFRNTLASDSMPIYQMDPDLAVLLYLGAAVLIATLMAGLSPAMESLRVDVLASMKQGEALSGRGANSRRNLLIGSQVAMSLVLLMCAALFIRARNTMYTGDPGYETRQALYARLELQSSEKTLTATIVDRLRELSGVSSVAAVTEALAGDFGSVTSEVTLPEMKDASPKQAVVSAVSANYFATLGIPILRGHTVNTENEVVVSEAFAQTFLAGHDAFGQRIAFSDGRPLTIAGVARDVKSEQLGKKDGPHVYRWQDPTAAPDALIVRFAGDPDEIAARVRTTIRKFDPAAEMPRTFRSILDDLASRFSTMVRLISVLAFLAFGLAVMGIYGVVEFAVSRRVREMGIRIALGASKTSIIRFILTAGTRPVLCGIAAGIVFAMGAARAIARLLRDAPIPIRSGDPVALAAISLLLLIAALAAMLRPAFRAGSADPAVALRED